MTSQQLQDNSPELQPRIHVASRYVPPTEPTLPALAVQITRLVDTYMLWVGTTDVEAEDVEKALLQGSFAKDWACAMPPMESYESEILKVGAANGPLKSGTPAPATSLYRSTGSDAALSMAQRLARRFKRQIFLSIDMPPSLGSLAEGKVVVSMERALVDALVGDTQAGES